MPDFGKKVRFEDARGIKMAASGKALLVFFDDAERWVPCSQIDDDSEVWKAGQEGTLVVSEWWAIENRLV